MDWDSAYVETLQKDVHALVATLNAGLGPTLVAALAGIKDRKMPIRWAKPDGPNPSPTYEFRLQAAHRAWSGLVYNEDVATARRWFIGGNPLLGEVTPITALREGRTADVLAAAGAFVRGDIDE